MSDEIKDKSENNDSNMKDEKKQGDTQEQQQKASDTSAIMLELEGRLNAKFENFKKELLSQKVEKKNPDTSSKKIEEEW